MSIVAVSNGRYLLGRGLGARIDGFDEVLRFSAAMVEGHEADVGSKTTIWAFAHVRPERMGDGCRRLWWRPRRRRKYRRAPPDVEVVPGDVEDEIRAATGMSPKMWPTTGMVALVHLLREFDVIHLAGWYKGGAAANWGEFACNYFPGHPDRPPQPFRWECHSPELESKHICSLTEQGRLADVERGG